MATVSRRQSGFTLAEVAISVLLFGLMVGGLYSAFLMGRVATFRARHQAQATNLLQAKLEELWAGSYDDVQDEGPADVIVDPGSDSEWGTSDDLVGRLLVEVDDRMDLDNDGDKTEQEIDLDGDGTNDACKPVHVSLTWESFSFGGNRSLTVSLDTLIAKR